MRGKQEIKLEKRNKIKPTLDKMIYYWQNIWVLSPSSKIEKHRFKIIHENCHCYHFLSLEFSPSNKTGFYIKDESESGRSGLGPYCETSWMFSWWMENILGNTGASSRFKCFPEKEPWQCGTQKEEKLEKSKLVKKLWK